MGQRSSPTRSKLAGHVVEYASDPEYSGLDAYLLVTDWHRGLAVYTGDLAKCTIFDSPEAADKWRRLHPHLLGPRGHLDPAVKPVWQVTAFALDNPNREERQQEFMGRLWDVVEADRQ